MAAFAAFGPGPRRAHQREDGLDDGFADRQPPHQALRGHQILGGHRRLGPRFLGAGRLEQDFSLGVAVGIVDVDLHQEAVELGFRQRIGAFLLERVLRGEHMERLAANRGACRRR